VCSARWKRERSTQAVNMELFASIYACSLDPVG
jgi:hypothetical protein